MDTAREPARRRLQQSDGSHPIWPIKTQIYLACTEFLATIWVNPERCGLTPCPGATRLRSHLHKIAAVTMCQHREKNDLCMEDHARKERSVLEDHPREALSSQDPYVQTEDQLTPSVS